MKVLPGDQRTGCELEPRGHKGDKEISHESGPWVPLTFSWDMKKTFLFPRPTTPYQGHQGWTLLSKHQPPHPLKPSGCLLLLLVLTAPDPSLLPLQPLHGPNSERPAVWIPQAWSLHLQTIKLKSSELLYPNRNSGTEDKPKIGVTGPRGEASQGPTGYSWARPPAAQIQLVLDQNLKKIYRTNCSRLFLAQISVESGPHEANLPCWRSCATASSPLLLPLQNSPLPDLGKTLGPWQQQSAWVPKAPTIQAWENQSRLVGRDSEARNGHWLTSRNGIRNGTKKWDLIMSIQAEKPNTVWEGRSVQFSSVAQSCPTLCDRMNCSTPGLPVHHQLPEFTQTHVHWVSDAIQPSHPLSSLLLLPPIPPSIRVFSNESTLRMRWTKYWSFSFSISPSKEHPGLISFRMD